MFDRILVTGAAGFVGYHLLQVLASRADASARLFAAQRTHVVLPSTRCELIRLDITDPEQVKAAIRETRPTCVVHLAAISAPRVAARGPRHTFDVNVAGTLNLAAAILQDAPEARFLFIGTSEVYGGSFQRCTSRLMKPPY
ncbi:NAD-dependent epimerase/dehydratase family protein [Methylobacterium durans]|uniref:NAD-dependent epimerase/dehydratase family protein n=1 Tax=Methylobacterium durans TaxID=2202825 RepID=UPI00202B1FCE|nr:NAD-dependent epimerase/dehydratase family protein [Methylobacterium durans]